LLGKPAGQSFDISVSQMQTEAAMDRAAPIPDKFYGMMKSIAGEGIRTVRDLIWLLGRYNDKALNKFIDDFQPDVVFSPRLLTPKLLRLEKTIAKMTTAPFVVFTGDDEASFLQISYSPLYWIKRIMFRKA